MPSRVKNPSIKFGGGRIHPVTVGPNKASEQVERPRGRTGKEKREKNAVRVGATNHTRVGTCRPKGEKKQNLEARGSSNQGVGPRSNAEKGKKGGGKGGGTHNLSKPPRWAVIKERKLQVKKELTRVTSRKGIKKTRKKKGTKNSF